MATSAPSPTPTCAAPTPVVRVRVRVGYLTLTLTLTQTQTLTLTLDPNPNPQDDMHGDNLPQEDLRYGVHCDVSAEVVAGYYNASLTVAKYFGHAQVREEFHQDRMNAYQVAPDDTAYMLQVRDCFASVRLSCPALSLALG